MLTSVETVDLSDGGALAMVSEEEAPAVGSLLNIELDVTCETKCNSSERKFTCSAKVVRRYDPGLPKRTGVAMEFSQPLELDLESSGWLPSS